MCFCNVCSTNIFGRVEIGLTVTLTLFVLNCSSNSKKTHGPLTRKVADGPANFFETTRTHNPNLDREADKTYNSTAPLASPSESPTTDSNVKLWIDQAQGERHKRQPCVQQVCSDTDSKFVVVVPTARFDRCRRFRNWLLGCRQESPIVIGAKVVVSVHMLPAQSLGVPCGSQT